MADERITRIYVLRDPRDGAVRYVGKTCGSLASRLHSHVCDAKRRSTRSSKWIRSLLSIGLRPQIDLIETTGPDWAEREAFWIAAYRQSIGDRLTNHTNGGEGAPGVKRSAVSIAASAAGLAKSWTPERKAKAAKILADRNRKTAKPWALNDPRRVELATRNEALWTPERRAALSALTAARNKILKPKWTEERKTAQAEVAKAVNERRWGGRKGSDEQASFPFAKAS